MSLILDSSLEAYEFCDELKQQIENSLYIPKPEIEITLSYKEGVLQLDSKLFPKVFCDFLSERYLKEVRQSFGRSEGVFSFLRPMAKNEKIKICDLTVGMGKDLFKFVLAGHDVVGFERNPIFYHLVSNGIKRFENSDKLQDLKDLFKVNDFSVELKMGEAKPDGLKYDLVYFDPMFDDASKKAAPKKGMQALKGLSFSSEEGGKNSIIEAWSRCSKHFIYKCAGKPKDFPFEVSKELKGKGFSYLIL